MENRTMITMNIFKQVTALIKSRQLVLVTIIALVSMASFARHNERKNVRSNSALPGDVIAEWNQEAVKTVLAAIPIPNQHTRAMAIVQVSVHDAVNGITGEFETYLSRQPAPAGASPEAAAIAAASLQHHSRLMGCR
jgi:hypothetical protein